MAFGLPGTEPTTGEFLSRLQYDTRVGFFKIVRRTQAADGSWMDEETEPFKNPTMLIDFGSLDIGYIKFASPPVFLLVPYGSAIPVQPEEMQTNAQGRQTKAFNPGFRLKVYGPKTFGDKNAYFFAHNSKTVLGAMDALHQVYLGSPEAVTGQIPLVTCTGTTVNEITTKHGTNKFYSPVFAITAWHDRPEVFGARTVPAPTMVIGAGPAAAQAPTNGAGVAPKAPPVIHTAAARAPVVTPPPAQGGGTAAAIDDDLPFGPCWQ